MPSCKVCDHQARKVCSRCKNMFYCSVECQSADWPKHSTTCTETFSYLVDRLILDIEKGTLGLQTKHSKLYNTSPSLYKMILQEHRSATFREKLEKVLSLYKNIKDSTMTLEEASKNISDTLNDEYIIPRLT